MEIDNGICYHWPLNLEKTHCKKSHWRLSLRSFFNQLVAGTSCNQRRKILKEHVTKNIWFWWWNYCKLFRALVSVRKKFSWIFVISNGTHQGNWMDNDGYRGFHLAGALRQFLASVKKKVFCAAQTHTRNHRAENNSISNGFLTRWTRRCLPVVWTNRFTSNMEWKKTISLRSH